MGNQLQTAHGGPWNTISFKQAHSIRLASISSSSSSKASFRRRFLVIVGCSRWTPCGRKQLSADACCPKWTTKVKYSLRMVTFSFSGWLFTTRICTTMIASYSRKTTTWPQTWLDWASMWYSCDQSIAAFSEANPGGGEEGRRVKTYFYATLKGWTSNPHPWPRIYF